MYKRKSFKKRGKRTFKRGIKKQKSKNRRINSYSQSRGGIRL